DTVIESAARGAAEIVMFQRVLYTPPSVEVGVLIVAALSASAMLAVVTAIAIARGRRLRRRLAEELSERTEELKQSQVGATGLATLLPSRVAELQTSVETLTIRRNELLDEIRQAEERRARKTATNVVSLPEAEPVVDVSDVEGDGEVDRADRPEPAGTA
ncbi:MAG TPA: hypothetical protein VF235_02885, partial [Actinomycetota bacterium]